MSIAEGEIMLKLRLRRSFNLAWYECCYIVLYSKFGSRFELLFIGLLPSRRFRERLTARTAFLNFYLVLDLKALDIGAVLPDII